MRHLIRFALLLLVLFAGAMFLRRPLQRGSARGETRTSPAEAGTLANTRADAARANGSAATQPDFAHGALFAYVAAPARAAEIEREEPAPAQWLRYVALNPAVASGKGAPFWKNAAQRQLTLPLPDGRELAVELEPARMLGVQRFVATGMLVGRPGSRVIFASSGGLLQGSVRDLELGTFTLRQFADGTTQFFHVDEDKIPPCGGAPVPPAAVRAVASLARRAPVGAQSGGDSGPTMTAAEATTDAPVIQVMMLYTQAVITSSVNASVVQGTFDLAIQKVNDAFSASRINARVELVRVASVAYNESTSTASAVQSDALTALQSPDDGKMDSVHTWRNEAGADLVCLAVKRSDTSSSGLGYLLETPGDNLNADYAFSVVQYDTIGSSEVVPHELGHNFGCAHDRQNASRQGAFSFSYGYRFFGANGVQYRTIMSYTPGTRVSYYSDPDIVAPGPISVPLGVRPGLPGESDNAETIRRTAFEVSQFRLQTQFPPTGTLVNVSTRAFVGDGERQLIGGFVVGGSDTKRVLVRAVGPALATLGVAQPETNPVMTIHRLDVDGVIAGNDDWSLQTAPATAAEIVTTSNMVGAFALPNGSKDAALLLTLPAGGYTINVTGENNGEALVEAYEVENGSGRVLNLSTRGYVEKGKPMIGGFVIRGTPSRTKRVLLRVLGPTLETMGVSNGLFDPFMSIYDASGELLLSNDDWSADAQDTISTHAEELIVGSGFMPLNRREPAVILDLQPGLYTMIVTPFEALDRTPPQLAQPGVAVMEVYELEQ